MEIYNLAIKQRNHVKRASLMHSFTTTSTWKSKVIKYLFMAQVCSAEERDVTALMLLNNMSFSGYPV